MIREQDIVQEVYDAMTHDLFLSSQGKKHFRHKAERAARAIMPMVEQERDMLERRRSRTVMVQAVRRLEVAGD